jgi:hypothetical protein
MTDRDALNNDLEAGPALTLAAGLFVIGGGRPAARQTQEGRNMATAAEWTVLDNLEHHWPVRTNLPLDVAEAAYEACEARGWVSDGAVTPAGKVELLKPLTMESEP